MAIFRHNRRGFATFPDKFLIGVAGKKDPPTKRNHTHFFPNQIMSPDAERPRANVVSRGGVEAEGHCLRVVWLLLFQQSDFHALRRWKALGLNQATDPP